MRATILQGAAADIRQYCARWLQGSESTVLFTAPRHSGLGAWAGLRCLLHQVRRDERASAVVQKHPSSCLVEALAQPERSEPEEVQLRFEPDLSARLDSHLTHNWIIQAPAFYRLAKWLRDLLHEGDLTLVVPTLGDLTPEDRGLLLSLVQQHSGSDLRIVLGEVEEAHEPELDDQGIRWLASASALKRLLFHFQGLPGADFERVPKGRAEKLSEPIPWEVGEPDFWVEVEELKVLASLDGESGPVSAELARRALEIVRCCFRGFAFTSALRLGKEILSRPVTLEPLDEAELWNRVALAAHNRQFGASGNLDLARFLERHYVRALELETRPELRCSLLYRLAVTTGRRQKQFEEAFDYATRAVETSWDPSLSPISAAYQEAWAYNIRAYALSRLRRGKEAVADLERGYDRIAQGVSLCRSGERDSNDITLWDLQATHSLIASNLVAVGKISGQAPTTYLLWQEVATKANEGIPGTEQFDRSLWADLHRRSLRMDRALEANVRGLEVATATWDVGFKYSFLTHLADLHHRLQQSEDALQVMSRILELRRRGNLPDRESRLEFVSLYLRSGRLAEAWQILEQASTEDRTPEQRAQVLGLLAWVGALQGEPRATVEVRIREALQASVASGRRGILIQVAVLVGRTLQELGRPEDALEAFGKAEDLSRGPAFPSIPAEAADLVMALVSLQEQTGISRVRMERLLPLLPKALRHGELWWELNRLLEIARQAARSQPDLLRREEMQGPLEALKTCGRQRPDCREALAAFERALGLVTGDQELVGRAAAGGGLETAAQGR